MNSPDYDWHECFKNERGDVTARNQNGITLGDYLLKEMECSGICDTCESAFTCKEYIHWED